MSGNAGPVRLSARECRETSFHDIFANFCSQHPGNISMSTLTSSVRQRGPGDVSAVNKGLFAVAAFLSVAVALVSYRYLFGIDVLPLIPLNHDKNPFLIIHIVCAATALLIMPLQLIPRIRSRRPALHRWVGRTYVVACVLGSIAGFMLAMGTAAGPVAGVGFGLLATVWFATTALGWRAAWQRRFADHRAWIIRSFALTFAAVTLRVYIPIALGAGLPFMPSYLVISYLCWIPNLIVAELYLRLSQSKPGRAGAA